ncbi:MAG: NADH-quinone oxidoreductase subunit C [Fluviicola sp.]|jgi:NADH-quinone oxidoreductase subunit C|nr:NADH-quinone oxidoreductase subunit C [Fluviicola sp.]
MANSTLSNETVYSKLKEKFGEAISESQEPFDLLTVEVSLAEIHNVIEWLKNEPSLQINYLTLIGGIHYPENTGRELGVTYHLHSLIHNFRIRLKTFLSIENPTIPTITDLYVGANWMERETFDFYGVIFSGHPNLIRVLNEESMDYFPMRKEFRLEDGTREDKDDRFFGR